jgi:hypothetical protein
MAVVSKLAKKVNQSITPVSVLGAGGEDPDGSS